jgi:hypothetical protein
MADPIDPQAAPMHHEIEDRFAPIHVVICGLMGAAAAIVGLILGIVLVND